MSSDKVAVSRKQISGEAPLFAAEIIEGCVYTGLFGTLDSARIIDISEKLTRKCEGTDTSQVIIDLGNVDAIDTAVSAELIRLAKTLEFIGVTPIFCGIKGVLARTMVSAGVGLNEFRTVKNLKSALSVCLDSSGREIVNKQ